MGHRKTCGCVGHLSAVYATSQHSKTLRGTMTRWWSHPAAGKPLSARWPGMFPTLVTRSASKDAKNHNIHNSTNKTYWFNYSTIVKPSFTIRTLYFHGFLVGYEAITIFSTILPHYLQVIDPSPSWWTPSCPHPQVVVNVLGQGRRGTGRPQLMMSGLSCRLMRLTDHPEKLTSGTIKLLNNNEL